MSVACIAYVMPYSVNIHTKQTKKMLGCCRSVCRIYTVPFVTATVHSLFFTQTPVLQFILWCVYGCCTLCIALIAVSYEAGQKSTCSIAISPSATHVCAHNTNTNRTKTMLLNKLCEDIIINCSLARTVLFYYYFFSPFATFLLSPRTSSYLSLFN